MNRSQLAINSVSTIRAGLVPSLEAYQAAGFRNVEFSLGQVRDYVAQGHSLDEFRQLLSKLGLHCIGGFECVVECFSPEEQRARNRDRILDNARFLAQLGAKTMVVGTDGPSTGVTGGDLIGPIAQEFAHVAEMIAGTGVTLCIEFNWSPVVKSLRTAAEISRRTGKSNVGVVFDPAHYYCTPTKFDQLTASNIAQIRHVHMDDMRDKPAEWSNCNSDRVLPGQGILDLKSMLSELDRHGYDGYYAIELFNEDLWAMPVDRAAVLMYESLIALCGE